MAHEAGLAAHLGRAHFSFNFRSGNQGGHRVHHHQVDRARSHQLIHHFQPHFPRVRLGNQQIINIHPKGLGINRIQGVFCIHKGRNAARSLHLRDRMEC